MERGSVASWEDLHPPLLELILECLPTADYVRFAVVCSSWLHVQQNHCTASPSRLMRMPWLMFPVLSPKIGPDHSLTCVKKGTTGPLSAYLRKTSFSYTLRCYVTTPCPIVHTLLLCFHFGRLSIHNPVVCSSYLDPNIHILL